MLFPLSFWTMSMKRFNTEMFNIGPWTATERYFKFNTFLKNEVVKKNEENFRNKAGLDDSHGGIRNKNSRRGKFHVLYEKEIYSLYFKREAYTNCLLRYCTKFYTVKALRAIQNTHIHTHAQTTVLAHRHSTSMQPADVAYRQFKHAYSREQAKT